MDTKDNVYESYLNKYFDFIETASHCVAQASLEIPVLLPLSIKDWD